MQVKILMSLSVDTKEYPMPVDGYVADEIKEALKEYIYDIDGIELINMNVIQKGLENE